VRRYAGHPLVGEVRGVGLLAGLEIVQDKAAKRPFPAKAGAAALVQAKCQENGLILRAMGDTIAFCPPLVITEAEIEEMLARFATGFGEAAAILARNSDGMST
jgi:4-aminobutyrate--pyruvate transaminase